MFGLEATAFVSYGSSPDGEFGTNALDGDIWELRRSLMVNNLFWMVIMMSQHSLGGNERCNEMNLRIGSNCVIGSRNVPYGALQHLGHNFS